MGKELVKQTNQAPATLIEKAIAGQADLDKLEKVLLLQERWEANQARKAYHRAMADFKANPPKIDKDKKVSFGQGKTAYNHASLANVCEKINIELSKHGLSASWTTKQNGAVVVTCKITHELGHSEETSLSAPADTSGSKNAIQAIGSTITYLERYTLLALTGLATYDQDDDGNGAGAKLITESQVLDLQALIDEVKADKAKFLKFLKVEKLEDITTKDYPKAVTALEQKRKENASESN